MGKLTKPVLGDRKRPVLGSDDRWPRALAGTARRRSRLFVLVFTLVLALAAGACGEGGGPPVEPDEAEFEWDTTPAEPAEEERPSRESRRRGGDKRRPKSGRRTRVTDVIDGDTVDTAKLGRVRLIGADTPEAGECHDDAATRFTRDRLSGTVVRYELGEERTDRYGRTLAYLWRGGRMHNLDLVREGYAEVLTIPPNDRYADRFEAAERTARRGDKGRWGACENGGRRPPEVEKRPRRRPRGGAGSLPPPPPDLACSDLSGPVTVGSNDPHRLDADGDGAGCE